jgi:predicted amidophosphoribosyltransferase
MAAKQPEVKGTFCSVCGEPAPDIICERCRAKIQGEAAHKKQQIEKEVRTDTGRK